MQRNRITRVCVTCGKTFERTARYAAKHAAEFCSSACRRVPYTVRFWQKVQKAEDLFSCWLWTGNTNPQGCAWLYRGPHEQGTALASRISWEIHYGAIPDGLFVCHHCDNRRCVRPDHLFLGTHLDNMHDCTRKGRRPRGDRSGARLHPESVPRGERHRKARLTEADVKTIRLRYASGSVTKQALAKEYGVGHTCIWSIIARVNWRHI